MAAKPQLPSIASVLKAAPDVSLKGSNTNNQGQQIEINDRSLKAELNRFPLERPVRFRQPPVEFIDKPLGAYESKIYQDKWVYAISLLHNINNLQSEQEMELINEFEDIQSWINAVLFAIYERITRVQGDSKK